MTDADERLSVRIQHHPSRALIAGRLRDQLAPLGDVEIVPDPDPDGKSDSWRAHRAALQAIPDGATHLMIVQDDALPHGACCEQIETALWQHPETVLLAFVPGFGHEAKAIIEARARREYYTPFNVRAYVPLVAIIYPRDVALGVLEWERARAKPLRGADDGIISTYFKQRRLQPLALVPCAFDHDDTVQPIGKHARSGPHRRAALL